MAKTLACLGAALALASLGPAAGTAAASGQFHHMPNVGTGLCFAPQSDSFGAPIIQEDCGTADPGHFLDWQVSAPQGTNLIRLQNQGSGLCAFVLDDPGNGTPVTLDECDLQGGGAVSNAEWNSFTRPPNAAQLRTLVGGRDHNLCLSGVSVALSVRTCNGADANQRWLI
ncbi:RICIN domain-containing protein [Kutzneria buriramensis]|nr:ricin-type beta-trefoil lectin domain protein [Kutzneria buriramensis]